jgi:hypothetical protein
MVASIPKILHVKFTCNKRNFFGNLELQVYHTQTLWLSELLYICSSGFGFVALFLCNHSILCGDVPVPDAVGSLY